MAREAKQASEDQIEAKRVEEARRKQREDDEFNTDVATLEQDVMPILEEAAASFRATGVNCEVTRNWLGIGRPMHPSLLFKCKGVETRIPQTGGVYTPAGNVVSVLAQAGAVTVKVGKDNHDRFGSFPISGDWRTALDKALRQALDTYHAHVAEHAALF